MQLEHSQVRHISRSGSFRGHIFVYIPVWRRHAIDSAITSIRGEGAKEGSSEFFFVVERR